MERNDKTKEQQPNNPLHGVKLAEILDFLLEAYGWSELGSRIRINCFNSNPTKKSSLKFLRQTPWAREKVETLYLRTLKKNVKPQKPKKKFLVKSKDSDKKR